MKRPSVQVWPRAVFGVLCLVLAVEAVRDAWRRLGDFKGYVETGGYVLDGTNVYVDPATNTWPPFFALVCAPIAWASRIDLEITHLLWLVASVVAWWLTARWIGGLLYSRPVALWEPALLLPLLFTLRLMLENMASIQINALLLGLCAGAVLLWSRGRDALGGLCLGLATAIKVYPIFVFAYFLLRGHWRMAGWTLAWLVLATAAPFAAFGVDAATEYYALWGAKAFGPLHGLSYMNQSLMALAARLLSETPAADNPATLGADYYINLASWSVDAIKRGSLLLIAAVGGGYLWLTRLRRSRVLTPGQSLDLGLAFGACALVTPIVWKSYGVFWLPLLLAIYPFLYAAPRPEAPYVDAPQQRRWLRGLYHAGWLAMTLSSELFLGGRGSDVAEAYGAMTIGGLVLIGTAVYLRLTWGRVPGRDVFATASAG